MGDGLIPPARGTSGVPLDEGLLARASSPPPGAVALNPKGGGAKPTAAAMADAVVSFARQRLGQRVGDGECFTLVNRALRAAGAKSAADYGVVTPDADYVWGTAVSLSDLRAGNLVQFRDYELDVETVTEEPDGSTTTWTEQQTRPHHSAIVERVGAAGEVTVLEQNAPVGAPVTRTRLSFQSGSFTTGTTTTTVQVRGTLWFYRAEAR